jgi:hypothetical protein
VVFILIAFAGVIPGPGLVNTILTQWVFKSGYEAIATPLTYAVTNFLKRVEGLDTFDVETNFNPVAFGD